jgi:predicted ATPase/class 3 adenylate cyclase
MRCPSCGIATVDGMHFYGQCGTMLPKHCPACGFTLPANYVFCGQCGARLPEHTLPPCLASPAHRDDQPAHQTAQVALPPAERRTPEAERRQLTVLFCDLVDSTVLASQLDPEEWREVVRAYQATCAEVIQRFDGHIAQYLGDGLLVYFGYPQAHEDDAQRAVRAGLGILEAMGPLNTRLERDKGVRLAARIGIHTGPVVVGEMGGGGRHEPLASGETPNVAARLQGIAAPHTVAISDAILRLVEGYFTYEDLGPHRLKGVETPLRVSRITGESGAQTRLEVVAARDLTPLVGREHEIAVLLDRWAQAQDGRGQVVVLSGEAVIGKSRLLQVLKDRAAGDAHTSLECRGSPYYQHTAWYPVTELWERVWAFARDDAPGAKLEKMAQALTQYRLDLTEAVPLSAALLALPLPDHCYPPLTLSPQRQRQKTLETLLAMVVELTEQQPLLCIVEDLHWADPSTIEWLTLVIDQTPTSLLYLLLTCRPTFHPPWGHRSYLTQLTVNRLTQPQATQMVGRMAGGNVLPAEIIRHLVEKADGVPLYIEEMPKAILESGLRRDVNGQSALVGSSSLAIPATLQDSLMARLDRLGPAKGVAQMGATIGRQFAYEVLQAVSPLDEETLQHELRQLVDAELVYQRGIPPRATYLFKHALIQEAAYQSLLKSTRQQYHRQIARVLAERFPDIAGIQPELLAHHPTEAGLMAEAIPYWQRAGQRALERSAYVEAIAHLTKGLELLKTLPDTPERAHQELTLHIALGVPLRLTKGYADPEVETTYTRARELCWQVGDPLQLSSVLLGLLLVYFERGQVQTAHELAEQLLTLAQCAQDPALLALAHLMLGNTLYRLGEFAPTRAHLEEGMALYDPQQHCLDVSLDTGVGCLSGLAWALWQLGYPDQALRRSHEALTLAQELARPFSLAYALSRAAILHLFRREGQATQARAEALMALAHEQRLPTRLAEGTYLRGWALAAQGQGAEGLDLIRQGLAAWHATGAEQARPNWLALLAEVCGKCGQVDKGLAVLAEALAAMQKHGSWWEPELYRLKGELLLTRSAEHHAEAEACFQQALEVARRQQAKSWELRAALSLSRLWQSQGKTVEARELLTSIYGWFTEGFDTADLQEAKTLLEEL